MAGEGLVTSAKLAEFAQDTGAASLILLYYRAFQS